jgi:hypothetical protein
MTKSIALSAVLSLLLASLLTGVGVLGLFGPLHYILEPGSLLCRRFLGSRDPAYWDGGMITAVIWTNFALYTLLVFTGFICAQEWIRKTKDAQP